jgi:hypothetical protein
VAVASLVAGVAGMVIGIPLVVIDGKPTCDPGPGRDPAKVCREVYNTAGGGGTLIGLGAAGLAAAGALFYFDYRSRHRPAGRVSFAPLREGGLVATVGGQF